MFTYTPVTNTYKINQHFAKCKKEPLIIIEGSQGASKTVSILMLIIDYFRNNPKLEITITSAEKTKLMDTAFQDLKKICLDWNIWHEFKWNDNKSKLTALNSSTGFIEFIGLDKDDLGKGRRRDLIYINELNKTTQQKFFDITQRAKKVVVDYNPDKRFFVHELVNETNFLRVDFTGNEKLSEEEKRNILSYKAKGFLLDDYGDFILENGQRVIKNAFYANKWIVYGEGQIGGVEGRIYYFNKCTIEEYNKVDAEEFIGVDWGKVDPFAIVGVKYKDCCLYVHEYNYLSENQLQERISSTEIMADTEAIPVYMFRKLGISQKANVVCDNNRPMKIRALREAGWEYVVPVGNKIKIIERISMVQELSVYFTETSKNIENEQFESCWKKDRAGVTLEEREDIHNHTLDAIEYVVLYLKYLGLI